MVNGGDDAGARVSVESESDALSTIPPIETPSSSPSSPSEDDPPFELVPINENDGEFESQSPPVVILDGDTVYSDPMADFPSVGGESVEQAARNLAQYMQYSGSQQPSKVGSIADFSR
jgi:ubiquitin carboxyl-terminal hydrolase 34